MYVPTDTNYNNTYITNVVAVLLDNTVNRWRSLNQLPLQSQSRIETNLQNAGYMLVIKQKHWMQR
jgi:hypothetical protein